MRKITLLVVILLFSIAGVSQTLNQSAAWPNASWVVTGTYNAGATAFEADPTSTANFAFDDDDAGGGSDDDIAAESPVIDLTAAHGAGETLLSISGDYVYNYLASDELKFQYWDADGASWVDWGFGFTADTAGAPTDDYCSGTSEVYISSDLDIVAFTPTQLSGFRYRISYNDDPIGPDWNYGFCFQSPTITSVAPPACPDPTALIADNFTAPNFADVSWTAAAGATGYNWEIQPQGTPQGTPGEIDFGTTATTNDTATNLVDGTDYTLYAQSDCGGPLGTWIPLNFTYNLPPTNDECANAIALTVNTDYSCGTVTAGTTVGATASAQADDVTGTPNTDVWYSFVATGTNHRVSLSNVINQGGGTDTSTDMGMGVYDATGGCGALVFFDDSDPDTLDLTGLTPATTYYVRVYGWYGTIQYNNFDICIGSPPAPPSNDDCASAAVVTALPYNFVQDASGATNNAGFISQCAAGMNDGVWYTFTTVNAGTVDIAVTGVTGWDPELAIFSGSCGGYVCESSADAGGTGGNETLTAVPVAAATQYWINIGQWSGTTDNSEGPFTIDISTADTTTLGIEELQLAEGFKFYPNPVNDVLTISAKNNIEQLQVVNMLGQVVKIAMPNMNSYQLDFSQLSAGVYFVKASINDSEGTFRIVKK